MGRKRKKTHLQGKRSDRGHYRDIIKVNESYQHYYKEQKCFDSEEYDAFLEAMKLPLPAVFRITGYKKHSRQLLKNMKKNHFVEMLGLRIEAEAIKTPVSLPWYPEELAWQTDLNRTQIRKAPQLQKFHAFLIAETESGHITRQEAVSMIPPLLLDIKPHHKVLDMCAAPGSKTAQIIELLHQDDAKPVPDGLCVANDKDNKRCYMLVHQMNRLNSPSTIIVNHDAATFPEIYLKNNGEDTPLRYDRVLCDVPCSGDGTMRKNSDVWVKWTIANSIYLHGIQLRILMRGLELLSAGGQLVYSTCSLNPIEDEAVVAAALSKCRGAAELVKVELPGLKWSPGVSKWRVMDKSQSWFEKHSDLPEGVKHISKTMFPPENEELVKTMNLERCMRLLPHHQDTGGFFVSVLRKTADLPWQKSNETVKESKGEEDTSEPIKPPPRKKPRWVPGFKEDPFVFFGPDDDAISTQIRLTHNPKLATIKSKFNFKEWHSSFSSTENILNCGGLIARSFYGLDSFPTDQIMTRTKQDKKRHLYFVSKIVKQVLDNNIDFLKVVNTGVRAFSRSDNSHHDLKCSFRIVQNGAECLEPFMTKQVVLVKMNDISKLLSEEQPGYDTLSEELRAKLKDIDPGSLVYKYQPEDETSEVSCDLLMCGWKGHTSTRLYMCKNERMHFLNLIGQPVPEYLLPNKNSRRSRAEDGNKKHEVNGKEQAGNVEGDSKSDVPLGEKENKGDCKDVNECGETGDEIKDCFSKVAVDDDDKEVEDETNTANGLANTSVE